LTQRASRPAARSVRPGSWRPAAIAAAAGLAAFLFGTSAESFIIRAVNGDRPKLEWISDVAISAGVVALTYLWLHLRLSQMRLAAIEREQVALDAQLHLAAEIQRSLLPDLPRSTPGFRWAARMVPAGRVGGDFYDFLEPRAGVVLAVVGDVSGKGIPAALILSSLKMLFRTIARDTCDPASIAQRVSQALLEEHQGTQYLTAIAARLENDPPRLTYVNAGHPSGYLLRDGAMLTLDSNGPPMGLLPETRFVAASVALAPGDLGVLFTDGISEALESGPVTLHQALSDVREVPTAERSPDEICDRLLRAAAAGGGPIGVDGWQDDRTVLAFAVGLAHGESATAGTGRFLRSSRLPDASRRRPRVLRAPGESSAVEAGQAVVAAARPFLRIQYTARISSARTPRPAPPIGPTTEGFSRGRRYT
jgi:serine phosphatase RsbU (regulator of sigma subunit)